MNTVNLDLETAQDRYRRIILRRFQANRTPNVNPQALFFYAFDCLGLEDLMADVVSVLGTLGRPLVEIECTGKSYAQIQREILEKVDYPPSSRGSDNYRAVEEILGNKGITLTLLWPSRMKATQRERTAYVRELIKIVADAHMKFDRAVSDIVLIDYPSFLEAGAPDLLPYVDLERAIDPMELFPKPNDPPGPGSA